MLLSITAGLTVDYATHVGHSFLVQVLISDIYGMYVIWLLQSQLVANLIIVFCTQEGDSRPARVAASLARSSFISQCGPYINSLALL